MPFILSVAKNIKFLPLDEKEYIEDTGSPDAFYKAVTVIFFLILYTTLACFLFWDIYIIFFQDKTLKFKNVYGAKVNYFERLGELDR